MDKYAFAYNEGLGTDHLLFSIRGGGAGFFLLNSSFPNRSEKKLYVFNEVKNKTFVLHSVIFFKALFPGSYKGLQIKQNLTCIKHVDLLLAISAYNVN